MAEIGTGPKATPTRIKWEKMEEWIINKFANVYIKGVFNVDGTISP